MSPTITVPIRARYEIVEGQAILREAEYRQAPHAWGRCEGTANAVGQARIPMRGDRRRFWPGNRYGGEVVPKGQWPYGRRQGRRKNMGGAAK